MKKRAVFGCLAAAAILVLGGSSLIVTEQNEYKLIRQFGKVSRILDTPGVSFKIPFIQTADTLPKETLLYDMVPSDVITKDKKTMISDCYVLWRINEPLKFAQTLNFSIANAESRINTATYNATKNVISSMDQEEVISGRSGALADAVVKEISENVGQYGIEIITYETKQLDLPEDNKAAVYERMISERNNIAATYTAEGEAEAKVIRNTTDKEVAIQLSEAEKQSEILEAEGEAEYMRILADAYSDESKTEFYSFVRSLDALKKAMKGENKTIVLSEDSPIAEIFEGN
ncbi:MAG: protease modulator HflC [Clostridiales bacterium]|nr:protease modulator HflC [Clostridiales bacterium]